MQITDEVLRALCGPQEIKIYKALLKHEYMSTAKVVAKTGLPKTGVPSCLAKLRAKGLIKSKKNAARKTCHVAMRERLLVPQGPLRKTRRTNGADAPTQTESLVAQAITAAKNLEYALQQIEHEMAELRAFQDRVQGLMKALK